MIHDKVEIYGLGRLAEVVDFNNWNNNLDSSWNNSIISVIIDAGGVTSNDNDITKEIIKTKEDIDAELGNRHNIKLASLLTDF